MLAGVIPELLLMRVVERLIPGEFAVIFAAVILAMMGCRAT